MPSLRSPSWHALHSRLPHWGLPHWGLPHSQRPRSFLRPLLRRLAPLALLLPLAVQAAPPAARAAADSAPAAASPRDAEARAQDAALLNRITWGATPADLARLRELGAARYLQAQLHPDPRARLPPAVQQRIDALSISRQSADDALAEQLSLIHI